MACLLGFGLPALADEPTRRAQEELRKRNLYFGDIDGQKNPALIEALKHYQTRKGFAPTGQLDEETASSLRIQIATSPNSSQRLPDLPVLKSDSARELAEPDSAALEPSLEQDTTASPAPQSPTPQVAEPEHSRAEQITNFVRQYLHDAEGADVDAQVRDFSFPVQYFDHGKASREFVVKDTRRYLARWPQRRYELIGPVKFSKTNVPNQFEVEFTIHFRVANRGQVADGKTRNLWKIESDRQNFKILVINEQRLHD